MPKAKLKMQRIGIHLGEILPLLRFFMILQGRRKESAGFSCVFIEPPKEKIVAGVAGVAGSP